jgi:hypothetical protein
MLGSRPARRRRAIVKERAAATVAAAVMSLVHSVPHRVYRRHPMNNRELVDSLCAISAVLRETRRVHVRNFGTLIPHVFMSDVLARVGACLHGSARAVPRKRAEMAAILDSLELGMGGDRDTRNVISVSFVGDGELEGFFEQVKPLLGPKVRAQLQGK